MYTILKNNLKEVKKIDQKQDYFSISHQLLRIHTLTNTYSWSELLVRMQCAAVRTYRSLINDPPQPPITAPLCRYCSKTIQGWSNTLVTLPRDIRSAVVLPHSSGNSANLSSWSTRITGTTGVVVVVVVVGFATTSDGLQQTLRASPGTVHAIARMYLSYFGFGLGLDTIL